MILKLILFFVLHDLASVKSKEPWEFNDPYERSTTTTVPTTTVLTEPTTDLWFDYEHDQEFIFLVHILTPYRDPPDDKPFPGYCQGVALSSLSVITTAKCLFKCDKVAKYHLPNLKVVFTNHSFFYTDDNNTLSFGIGDVKLHPDFNCDNDNTGDLAIITLDKPIDMDQIPVFEPHFYNTTGSYRRAQAITWMCEFKYYRPHHVEEVFTKRWTSETFLSIQDAYESLEKTWCTKYIHRSFDYDLRHGVPLLINRPRPTEHSTDYYVIGLEIDKGNENKTCFINLRYYYEWIMPNIKGTDFGVYNPEPIPIDECTREYVCEYDGPLYYPNGRYPYPYPYN